jgi:hypothetical protein
VLTVLLLFVGVEVGMVKRSKAQMLKNAPFNVMEGTNGEIEVPKGELSVETIISLLAAASGSDDVSI